MVYAILLIFFGMTQAEQTVIIEAACEVPLPKVKSYEFDVRNGVTENFRDGSSLVESDSSIVVYGSEGIELYFAETRGRK